MNQPELSGPELKVFNWLTRHRIPFIPQQNVFGGVTEAGGAKVDYLLTESSIIIRVQSYWHDNPQSKARDLLQRVSMEAVGYTVVDVHERQIEINLNRVMRAAVEGRQL